MTVYSSQFFNNRRWISLYIRSLRNERKKCFQCCTHCDFDGKLSSQQRATPACSTTKRSVAPAMMMISFKDVDHSNPVEVVNTSSREWYWGRREINSCKHLQEWWVPNKWSALLSAVRLLKAWEGSQFMVSLSLWGLMYWIHSSHATVLRNTA